jgi:hypothetical protein
MSFFLVIIDNIYMIANETIQSVFLWFSSGIKYIVLTMNSCSCDSISLNLISLMLKSLIGREVFI